MGYDGTALIVVDQTGQKYYKQDSFVLDDRLIDAVSESDFTEQIGSQLPDGLTDALVLVVFRYQSVPCGPWEYRESEWEDVFTLEHHYVLRNSFKEYWQHTVSRHITYDWNVEWPRELETNDKEWVTSDIGEWEEFYDQEFTVLLKAPEPTESAQ